MRGAKPIPHVMLDPRGEARGPGCSLETNAAFSPRYFYGIPRKATNRTFRSPHPGIVRDRHGSVFYLLQDPPALDWAICVYLDS